VDKLEDGFELINKFPKPLAAYCFTKNKKLEEEFVQNVSAGGILINDVALHVSCYVGFTLDLIIIYADFHPRFSLVHLFP
jgi:acyl-CoA reductase-like NAD-dependent aldehyde dehydrogenase